MNCEIGWYDEKYQISTVHKKPVEAVCLINQTNIWTGEFDHKGFACCKEHRKMLLRNAYPRWFIFEGPLP